MARYAKKDIFREADEGLGVRINRLIARQGQAIPEIYAGLVPDEETTPERPPAPVVDETASTVPGVHTFGHPTNAVDEGDGQGGGGEPAGYESMSVPELEAAIADRPDLDPDAIEGTGQGGNVVKADLVAALEAADAGEGEGA